MGESNRVERQTISESDRGMFRARSLGLSKWNFKPRSLYHAFLFGCYLFDRSWDSRSSSAVCFAGDTTVAIRDLKICFCRILSLYWPQKNSRTKILILIKRTNVEHNAICEMNPRCQILLCSGFNYTNSTKYGKRMNTAFVQFLQAQVSQMARTMFIIFSRKKLSIRWNQTWKRG